MPTKGAERDVVARETRATKTQPTGEIPPSDALVGAKRIGHHIDVAAWNPLAQLSEHVSVGDFRRDECVDREFGQLGILDAHPLARCAILDNLGITTLQQCAAPLVELTNKREIGIEKISDDAAERDKFRTVAYAKIATAFFTGSRLKLGWQYLPGRSWHDRAGQYDEMIVLFSCKAASNLAECVARILK